ncbi:unnamed protein product [Lepeophtheirus salmonis]|uniref:(salmon louse) hypothetical protein n=1 Tax=Lepeophtheirus salmonis TaxID=72036 RepID=A0A7R8H1V1_LEPSM|nr:unnamed protein product [Lepeophtheirus salmonis]CAF2818187.1 unnamed protein product [Lepeophtheirus salmonis]
MPVNTSSTGASYGKSSDPLCPLGFHPQEHSDASDRKKYGDLETQKTNSWTLTNTNLRSGFTKSKSLDVSTDIPDWRKRMILRQEHKEIQMRFDIKDQHEEGVPKVSRSQSVQPEKNSTKPFSQNIEKSKNNELSFQEVQCILPEVNTNYDSKEFESHKALKISEELLKAKAKIREYEICISNYDKDKKSSVIKIKELENELEKRPLQSETQKIISELKTKYSFIEKKCHHLEKENDNLLNNVQNLEGELEEVQDNFREDEADEYRKENNILESKIKALSSRDESLSSINDSDKILHLEKELEERNILIKKLESHSSITNFNRRINGPTLNRSGSIESNIEDHLTKDLQDSIERENDLKEHLSMAEEESLQLRKQLSLVEDENESLTSQVKCLSSKAYGNSKKYKQSSSALTRDNERLLDKEESFSKEIKTQMDVKDQENISLRRKVENLINDNHKMAMQLKEFSKHKVLKSSNSRNKADQAQREVITIEREKRRRIEDEKIRANTNIAKLELEIRNLKSELNNTKEECDTLKRKKNRDNLVQTQDGVKVFKDQISNIKQELIDEQNKVKDTRELFENKVTQLQDELGKLSKSKDESLKKIKDLEEKWCKSKRINLQRKEKIENLEKQLECKKSDNDTMAKILSLEKENDSLRRICETKSSNYEFENLKSKYDDIEKER